MNDALAPIVERARELRRRIVLPESGDPRILDAAATLASRGIARPVLLGDPTAVTTALAESGHDAAGIELVDGSRPALRPAWRRAAADALAGRDVDVDELLDDPLYLAAAIVRAGEADGTVAGAVHATPDVLRAALRVIRTAEGVEQVSSYFLMALARPTAAGERLLAFADCGLVPAPGPRALADIAVQTARQFRLLTGREPRVAMLSFSTHGSAEHPAVERVRLATEMARDAAPGLALDGELQLDAALVPEVAAAKAPGSEVAGRANVLVFPDLGAGNIGYKLVERLAGAQAIGPVLQGLARPANDLSRGCAVADVVVAVAITALQSAAGADGRAAATEAP